MIVHCKICGKPVEVKSPNVKYCDECRRKSTRLLTASKAKRRPLSMLIKSE